MSAEVLREAAKVLRERAQAASPGPWEASISDSDHSKYEFSCSVITEDVADLVCGFDALWRIGGNERHGRDDGRHDAAYIATVSPPVGLALADWIDSVADMARKRGVKKFARGYKSALDVADAILGVRA